MTHKISLVHETRYLTDIESAKLRTLTNLLRLLSIYVGSVCSELVDKNLTVSKRHLPAQLCSLHGHLTAACGLRDVGSLVEIDASHSTLTNDSRPRLGVVADAGDCVRRRWRLVC